MLSSAFATAPAPSTIGPSRRSRALSRVSLSPALRPFYPPARRLSALLLVRGAPALSHTAPPRGTILLDLEAAASPQARLALLLRAARQLPAARADRLQAQRVPGCAAAVWVQAELDPASAEVRFLVDADAELALGAAAALAAALSGRRPGAWTPPQAAARVAALGLDGSVAGLHPATAHAVAEAMVGASAALQRSLAPSGAAPVFPALRLSKARGFEPQGAFAEAQAAYLSPDPEAVAELAAALEAKRMGVVAHFYMDPEVQGVLTAAGERWPHVWVSDSLVMADAAVRMAEAGCKAVAVLGVDFMSENVRAVLDEAGHADVPVYRLSEARIGCSLAEAAEDAAYAEFCRAGAAEARAAGADALHVVYINTSLRSKALADAEVPTLSCTSGNVVRTVLQAFAQLPPDARVLYGPDAYMGANLARLLGDLARRGDAAVRQAHPAHTAASVRSALERFSYFRQGLCVVHEMFGGGVADAVRARYADAFVAAHFEVPGEMFGLALEAAALGKGIVGSTKDILDAVLALCHEALATPGPQRARVVLGTETGMVTGIVRAAQKVLQASEREDVELEILFPVSSCAVDASAETQAQLPEQLALLPGPAAGEGCGAEGGCAACPYMKMNTLTALRRVASAVGTPAEVLLERYRPEAYAETLVGGKSLAAAGCVPILHMRDFQKTGKLGQALMDDIASRRAGVHA